MIMSVAAFNKLVYPSMLYSSQRILYDLYGDWIHLLFNKLKSRKKSDYSFRKEILLGENMVSLLIKTDKSQTTIDTKINGYEQSCKFYPLPLRNKRVFQVDVKTWKLNSHKG